MIRNFNALVAHSLSTGRRWEIAAIRNRPATIAEASEYDDLQSIPLQHVSVSQPWASGVALVHRADPVTTVTAVDNGHLFAFDVDGDRTIRPVDVGTQQPETVSMLWALSSPADPGMRRRETRRCLVLLAALASATSNDEVVDLWESGKDDSLCSSLDLPAGRSVPSLYALAHIAGVATEHPGADYSESEVLNALHGLVPPRWVIADDLSRRQRPDLARRVRHAR